MKAFRAVAAGWYHGVLLGALPWVAAARPQWAPALAAAIVGGLLLAGRGRGAGPWPGALACASALLFLLLGGGLALAAMPELMDPGRGGWLAPAVLLLAARDAALSELWQRGVKGSLLPPTREVRGTLSVRALVVRDAEGLPCTVPLELELRAGDSVAVLSSSVDDALALAETLAGRRLPVSGEVAVDGTPLSPRDRLVALVAFGEPFLLGGLEENLAALCEEYPDRPTIGAVIEACGLDAVADELDGSLMSTDGSPLAPVHRLQLAAARVIPSDYRVLAVIDPSPWTDPVRRELWRRTVVRASLGRTAVWFTADRELASRADRVMAFSDGALRRLDSAYEATP